LKLLKVLGYRGEFQDIFVSSDGDHMIVSTVAGENESVYLYAVEAVGQNYQLRQVYTKPFKMKHVTAGFNSAGNLAYITHKDITTSAFESPFSIISEYQQKTPVFPDYPFSIFKYNFVTKRVSVVKDLTQLEHVPIDAVKKYFLVYDTMETDNSVNSLIEKGQRLDLTSSSIVKVYFSKDLESFLIYLSDLKNAFQAQLVYNVANRTFKVDETMFLGKGQYAELDLLDYNPHKKELVVLTKGLDRTLIRFNYRSFLYTRLADKVLEVHYRRKDDIYYILTERNKKSFYTETNLVVIYHRPYLRQLVDQRRDLQKVLFVEDDDVFFSTLDGEMVRMDGGHEFHYVGPSFQNSIHALSPDHKSTVAFINGNLFVIDRIHTDLLEQWAKNKNSKK